MTSSSNPIPAMALVLTSIFAFSCGSKHSGFNGNTKSAAQNAQADANAAPSGEASVPAIAPEGCKKNDLSLMKVKLLTEGLSMSSSDHTIRYQLSLVSCKDGSVQAIKNKPILFDLDVILQPFESPIAYTVSSANSQAVLANGLLDAVSGSDLFGNTGLFSHWQTPKFTYEQPEASLILDIRLQGIALKPRSGDDTMANSFLRIDKLEPTRVPLLWMK